MYNIYKCLVNYSVFDNFILIYVILGKSHIIFKKSLYLKNHIISFLKMTIIFI